MYFVYIELHSDKKTTAYNKTICLIAAINVFFVGISYSTFILSHFTNLYNSNSHYLSISIPLSFSLTRWLSSRPFSVSCPLPLFQKLCITHYSPVFHLPTVYNKLAIFHFHNFSLKKIYPLCLSHSLFCSLSHSFSLTLFSLMSFSFSLDHFFSLSIYLISYWSLLAQSF